MAACSPHRPGETQISLASFFLRRLYFRAAHAAGAERSPGGSAGWRVTALRGWWPPSVPRATALHRGSRSSNQALSPPNADPVELGDKEAPPDVTPPGLPASPPAPATAASHAGSLWPSTWRGRRGLCPEPEPVGSSKEHLSRAPCTPPPRGVTHPGASHGGDRPAATWVPTMALCPPLGCCASTLSSPWPPRSRGCALSPLHLLACPTGTQTLPSLGGGGQSCAELAHRPTIGESFGRDALPR